MKFTTLLVDCDVLLHRAVAYATTRVKFDDVESWEVDVKTAGGWIRRELKAYKDRWKPSKVILALGDRRANFRKELSPAYKSHRTGFPKPPGFLALEEKLRAHAKVVSAPRLEGDDILGILATTAPTEGKLIVSIDKDLRQVPGWGWNPDKDELHETTPDQSVFLHLFQTLTGDQVDGYPGLPGCGPVKAKKVLGSVQHEHLWPAVVDAFQKYRESLGAVDNIADDQRALATNDALLQARLAYVLQAHNYDRKTKEIKLWTPSN